MEPSEIVERIATARDEGGLVFEALRATSFADHRRRAVLSHYEGGVRLLFAVLTLAIRDWLAWNAQLDRARQTLERRALREKLQDVNEWLFVDQGRPCPYSMELCAEILNFDVGAFRAALRGFLERQRAMAAGRVNFQLKLIASNDGEMGVMRARRRLPIVANPKPLSRAGVLSA